MTANLNTGEFYKARREDYITKSTTVPPKTMDIPLWTSFLSKITAGDTELQAYLKRVAGYCLTGDTHDTQCSSSTEPAPTANPSSSGETKLLRATAVHRGQQLQNVEAAVAFVANTPVVHRLKDLFTCPIENLHPGFELLALALEAVVCHSSSPI
jgi:D5-like protein